MPRARMAARIAACFRLFSCEASTAVFACVSMPTCTCARSGATCTSPRPLTTICGGGCGIDSWAAAWVASTGVTSALTTKAAVVSERTARFGERMIMVNLLIYKEGVQWRLAYTPYRHFRSNAAKFVGKPYEKYCKT